LGPIPLPRKGIPQVVVSVGVVGLQLQRLAVAADRLVELAQMPQASAQVIQSQRVLRLNRERSANKIGRLFIRALGDQNVAQVIQRLEVIGPQAESLPI